MARRLTVQAIERAKQQREVDIRCVVYETLKHGGEFYVRELARAWMEANGPRDLRYAIGCMRPVLRAMEREGELASRLVLPSEHRSSQVARRYYRRSWSDDA